MPALKALAGLAGVAIALYQRGGGGTDKFDDGKAYEAILGQAVGGIVYDLFKTGGGATWENLKTKYRAVNLSADNLNHDLQKAARKAQLIASFFACQHCLAKLKAEASAEKSGIARAAGKITERIGLASGEEKFFAALIEYLDEQMQDDRINAAVYLGTLTETQFETVFNIYRQAAAADSRANVAQTLREDVLGEIELVGLAGQHFRFDRAGLEILRKTIADGWEEIPPPEKESKFVALEILDKRKKKLERFDWFDLVCAFFNEEYKNNPRFESAANKKLIVEISAKLDAFGALEKSIPDLILEISNFAAQLNRIEEKIDAVRDEQVEAKKRDDALMAKQVETIGMIKTIFPLNTAIESQTFVALPNLTENIYGREREIRDILKHLKTGKKHGAIIAPTCFGKTSLIKKFLAETLDDGRVKAEYADAFEKVIYIDCRQNTTFENIVRHFATLFGRELEYSVGDEANFLKLEVFGKLQAEKILLILDNFEDWLGAADAYLNADAAVFLKTFFKEHHRIRALFVSRFPPDAAKTDFSTHIEKLKSVTDSLLNGLDKDSALRLIREESQTACSDCTETDLDGIGDDELTAFLEEINYIPQAIMSMVYFVARQNISFAEFRVKRAQFDAAESDDTNIAARLDEKLRPTRSLLKLQIAALAAADRHILSLLAFFEGEVPREVLTTDFSKELSEEISFESENLRQSLNYLNEIHLIRNEIDEAREIDAATGAPKKIVYYKLHTFIGKVVRETDRFEVKFQNQLESFSDNFEKKTDIAWNGKLLRKQSALAECRNKIEQYLINELGRTDRNRILSITFNDKGLVFSENYYATGKKEYLVQAEANYRQAIELNPHFISAYNNLGNLLNKTDRREDAEANYSKLIEANPNSADAYSSFSAFLYETGRREEAEANYRKAIEANPNNAEAYNNFGILLKEMDRQEEAETSYRKAIELNPNYAEAYLNLGFLIYETDRREEAEASYRRAIEANPNYAPAYYNLGHILHVAGNEEEARANYRKAIESDPNYGDAYNNLGSLLYKIGGGEEEAEASFRKAIELNPNNAAAHCNLGDVLHIAGKQEEAEANYRQAIELNPNNAEAYYNLGNLLRETDRREEAETSYRKAIELNPNSSQAYNNLGLLLKEAGRIEEAEASYRQAIELDPNYATAYHNLGILLHDAGRREEAEPNYRKTIELDPHNATAYYNLGLLLHLTDRREEAEANYRKAIELNPNYADAHNNLGILLNEKGRREEAEASYRKSIEANPNYTNAYNNLGDLLRETDRPAEAEASYRKAIESDPHNATAYYNLGNVLNKTGKREESEANYRKAIELNPNYAEAHNNLGSMLNMTDRQEEAEASYRKAIELSPNYATAYYNLGNLLNKTDRREEAMASYRQAIESDPNHAGAYYNLACLHSLAKNKDKAFEYLKKAVEINSEFKSLTRTDADFDNVRDDERFREIVGDEDQMNDAG